MKEWCQMFQKLVFRRERRIWWSVMSNAALRPREITIVDLSADFDTVLVCNRHRDRHRALASTLLA